MVAEVMDMVCHTRSHIAYFFPEQKGLDVPLLFAVRCQKSDAFERGLITEILDDADL